MLPLYAQIDLRMRLSRPKKGLPTGRRGLKSLGREYDRVKLHLSPVISAT